MLIFLNLAGTLCYPQLLIRSRMQDQHRLYDSLRECIVSTWRNEGVVGFYKGLLPNLIRTVPASIITFYTYEMLRRWKLFISHSVLDCSITHNLTFNSFFNSFITFRKCKTSLPQSRNHQKSTAAAVVDKRVKQGKKRLMKGPNRCHGWKSIARVDLTPSVPKKKPFQCWKRRSGTNE